MIRKDLRSLLFRPIAQWFRNSRDGLAVYFWRVVYGIAGSTVVINLLAFAYGVMRRIGSDTRAQKMTRLLATLMTLNLTRRSGWVNLHTSRLYWQALQKAERRNMGVISQWPAVSQHKPLRVGVYGQISGTLLTQKPLFDGLHPDIELYIFDRRYKEYSADYLRKIASGYQVFVDQPVDVQVIAGAINLAGLDMLLNVTYDVPSFKVLDQINTPCIVHLCSGSDLLHHDKVSFNINVQPEAEFFVKDNYMFSTFTRQRFSSQRVYQGIVIFDIRDIRGSQPPLWEKRKPLIFWHGSLYKLAKPSIMDIITRLLADDSQLEFIFVGRDDLRKQASLPFIEKCARKRGVNSRVHYGGQMLVGRQPDGKILDDQGWSQITGYLNEARLWPNTFPVGGGAARVEAYASGTPSVHMGVRFDSPSWGQSQPGTVELPALLVPEGTAYSVQDYEALCRRCLYDQAHADSLILAQLRISERSTSGDVFWKQILEFHRDWLATQIQQ